MQNQVIDRDLIAREQIYLINDSFQNRKQYNIPKAQLVIADIPYNVGNNAYAYLKRRFERVTSKLKEELEEREINAKIIENIKSI